mmetsp:Transcript_7332/g.15951  ORF Transcript_7332/g.15951 Transcript_7332/m.15951 type:complete len:94 (+) Transcript_7332:910-1191(+)
MLKEFTAKRDHSRHSSYEQHCDINFLKSKLNILLPLRPRLPALVIMSMKQGCFLLSRKMMDKNISKSGLEKIIMNEIDSRLREKSLLLDASRV